MHVGMSIFVRVCGAKVVCMYDHGSVCIVLAKEELDVIGMLANFNKW